MSSRVSNFNNKQTSFTCLLAGTVLGFVLAILIVLQPQAARAQAAAEATYLIQFQPGTSEVERATVIANLHAELVTWIPQINVAEIKLDPANLGMAASALTTSAVVCFGPDTVVVGQHDVTDPGFVDTDKGYGQRLTEVLPAWNVTSGVTGTIVATVDSGLRFDHPEFAGRTVPGYDFINNDDDATDDNGHGTHVAGIIAAGLNGFGTVGMCPDCRIMPVKVLNAQNAGSWSTVSKGIIWAVDHDARVINISLGANVTNMTLQNAIDYATAHNVVIVAAAGNSASTDAFYPAALPNVIGVSATDRNDQLWPLSNHGDFIDVAAPGDSVYSSYFTAADPATYAYMSGTSMAAPFVSGLVGLVLSRRPELTIEQVTDLITDNAQDLGAAGWDNEFGYGRIDAYTTLVAANDGVEPIADNDGDNDDDDSDTGGNGETLSNHLYIPTVAVGA